MSNLLMEKMLALPEFDVTDFKQNDNDMGFYVQTKERPNVCSVCGNYWFYTICTGVAAPSTNERKFWVFQLRGG